MTDYEIKRGDSLWKIVKKELKIDNNAEISKKVKEIAELNGLKDMNSIFVGQHLKLYKDQEKPAPTKTPDRSPCFVFNTIDSPVDMYCPNNVQFNGQKRLASSPFLKARTESRMNQETERASDNQDKIKIETSQQNQQVETQTVKLTTNNIHNLDITTDYKGKASEIDKHLGGVLKGQGEKFMQLQDKYGINAAFLAAIAINESRNGTSYSARKRNNVGGIRYAGSYRFRTYQNVSDCLEDMASMLKRNYINKGRKTIKAVGAKYCPIDDKSDKDQLNQYWPRNVGKYMKDIINNTASTA